MAYLVITQSTPTEPPRYFGPYQRKSRADRAEQLLGDLGYVTVAVKLENADEAWRAASEEANK